MLYKDWCDKHGQPTHKSRLLVRCYKCNKIFNLKENTVVKEIEGSEKNAYVSCRSCAKSMNDVIEDPNGLYRLERICLEDGTLQNSAFEVYIGNTKIGEWIGKVYYDAGYYDKPRTSISLMRFLLSVGE